jgi:hypothetical protein
MLLFDFWMAASTLNIRLKNDQILAYAPMQPLPSLLCTTCVWGLKEWGKPYVFGRFLWASIMKIRSVASDVSESVLM